MQKRGLWSYQKFRRIGSSDYLSALNTETKEKLIGLFLDKKLLDNLDGDEEIILELDEIEEEMELEENNE